MSELSEPICHALRVKIEEQIERTAHLAALLPPGCRDWKPEIAGSWTTGVLLGHLLECLAGLCAVLYTVDPQRLAHFERLRELPVNHSCEAPEALARMAAYRSHIQEGFLLLRDVDLARNVPTLFVLAGEPLVTLLLGNLEHLINHKYQLFTHLKMMGVPVGTPDLYQFRE